MTTRWSSSISSNHGSSGSLSLSLSASHASHASHTRGSQLHRLVEVVAAIVAVVVGSVAVVDVVALCFEKRAGVCVCVWTAEPKVMAPTNDKLTSEPC